MFQLYDTQTREQQSLRSWAWTFQAANQAWGTKRHSLPSSGFHLGTRVCQLPWGGGEGGGEEGGAWGGSCSC